MNIHKKKEKKKEKKKTQTRNILLAFSVDYEHSKKLSEKVKFELKLTLHETENHIAITSSFINKKYYFDKGRKKYLRRNKMFNIYI